MARALDHLVLPCRDLDAAAAAYARLGFTVGRRNSHPWGTDNYIIQFAGVFLELIAPAPGAQPPLPEHDAFPFAGFLAGLAGSADPSGMIVLRSDDADADAAAFSRDGIGQGRRLDFSRSGAAPGGGTRTVSFSLAFATAESMRDVGFFTCRQHTPEAFWNPAMQRHANGATGIETVTIAAHDPSAQAEFLTRFTGAPASTTSHGLVFDCGNARIEVVGDDQADVRPARLAAIRFAGAAATGQITTDDGLVLLF